MIDENASKSEYEFEPNSKIFLFAFFFCLVYYLLPKRVFDRVGSEPKLGQSCVSFQRAIPIVY